MHNVETYQFELYLENGSSLPEELEELLKSYVDYQKVHPIFPSNRVVGFSDLPVQYWNILNKYISFFNDINKEQKTKRTISII